MTKIEKRTQPNKLKKYFSKLEQKINRLRLSEVDYWKYLGASIGKDVQMYNCNIDRGFAYLVKIGDGSTVTNVSILTHDASMRKDINAVKIGMVDIGKNCFIGFGTLIMPGVSIGDNSVVAARSLIVQDIPANVLVAGSPAKVIRTMDEYHKKIREDIEEKPLFMHPDFYNTSREEIVKALSQTKVGFSTIDSDFYEKHSGNK